MYGDKSLVFAKSYLRRRECTRTVATHRFQASKNARKDVLDAKLCWLAKPLAGDRIVRVSVELSD